MFASSKLYLEEINCCSERSKIQPLSACYNTASYANFYKLKYFLDVMLNILHWICWSYFDTARLKLTVSVEVLCFSSTMQKKKIFFRWTLDNIFARKKCMQSCNYNFIYVNKMLFCCLQNKTTDLMKSLIFI